MSTKIIKSLFALMLVLNIHQPLQAAVHPLNQSSGFISLKDENYVDNMNEEWNINAGTNKNVILNYSIDTDENYDFVTIFSVDAAGVATELITLSGQQSGTISTTNLSGKMKVVFTSDISVSYDAGFSGYTGFELSFTSDSNPSTPGQTSGFISIQDEEYVNNMSEEWDINAGVNKTVILTYDIDTEENFDFVTILNVDDANVATELITLSGPQSGTISTVCLGGGGRIKVVFTSDVSGSYDAEFTGFKIAYTSESYTISDNLFIKGNTFIDGKLGIGITNPIERLHVNGSIRGNGSDGALRIQTDNGYVDVGPYFDTDMPQLEFYKPIFLMDGKLSTSSDFSLQTSGSTRMTIRQSNGYIGIGTISPKYLLDVKGATRATEIRVQNVVPFPDFVFEKSYPLLSLSDVDQYIQSNNRLPNMPSAKDVKANGMSLADMQAKLLQKIEELTLYVIDQEKVIDRLERELEAGDK